MKSRFSKNISMHIIFILLFSSVPFPTYANDSVIDLGKPVMTSENPDQQKKLVAEDPSKRTEFVKHFVYDDHSYAAEVYPVPVHYKENGQWKDIDNTLTNRLDESNQSVFENQKSKVKIRFANQSNSNKLVRMGFNQYELSWNLDKALKTKAVLQNREGTAGTNDPTTLKNLRSSVIYSDIMPNVDLQYQLNSINLKENIILKNKTSIQEFVYHFNLKNLSATLDQNSVIFHDKNNPNVEVYRMEAPYMVDANGTRSNSVELNMLEDSNGLQLVVKPDLNWLNAAERNYPVVIDPTVTTTTDTPNILDSFASQATPTTNFGSNDTLKVGKDASAGLFRSYVKFNVLPTITSANVITKATFNLSLRKDNTTSSQLDVSKVNQTWDPTTITWNTLPSTDTVVQDYSTINGLAKTTDQWDITGIVKKWYEDQPNYGLMIKADNETGNYTEFYSGNSAAIDSAYRPLLSIDYLNNTGLEDFWTYHSLGVGRAGTGSVNDNSGNLVFVHSDLDMTGLRLPVSIQHVFNSNDRLKDNHYGYGWRLNYSQRIDWDANLNQYFLTDEDGTIHYFTFDSSKNQYNDESGLNIYMTIDNTVGALDKYILTDKANNVLRFGPNGNLNSLRD